MFKDKPLTIEVIDDIFSITIGVDTLVYALSYNPHFNQVPKVTDSDAFIEAIVTELYREEEDGTTLIHHMFDEACIVAIENGCEGIELPEPVGY